jgi:hypothetical protein
MSQCVTLIIVHELTLFISAFQFCRQTGDGGCSRRKQERQLKKVIFIKDKYLASVGIGLSLSQVAQGAIQQLLSIVFQIKNPCFVICVNSALCSIVFRNYS